MRAVGRVWEWFRDWLGRVRGVSTPLGGLQWDPPAIHQDSPQSQELDEPDLDDVDLDVLSLFARRDREYLWVDDLVDDLELTWARAQHHLDRLEALSLLESSETSHKQVEGDRGYLLTPQGRAVAVEHGLDEED